MRSSLMLKATVAAPPAVEPVRRSTATRRTVPPYLITAGLGFLALSLTGNILIDAELNGLYHFIFCYLALPVVSLSYGIAWLGIRRWGVRVSLAKAIVGPGLMALILLFTCSGLVNYANASLSNGAPVQFGGPITKLNHTSGRSGRGYYLVLSDTATGQAREFRITRQEYSNLKVGYAYIRTMKQGGLGYAFQWRH